MWGKINYILDRRQKRNLIILLFLIAIGAFLEMVGVSAVLPLVNLVMQPEVIETNQWLRLAGELLGITSPNQFIIWMSVALIVIYIIKNLYLILMYSLQYRFTYNNQRRIAKRLMECYMRQDYTYHLYKSSAELMRNINTDVPQFFTTLLNALQLATELLTCIALVFFLALQDFMTTLCVVLITFISLCVFYAIFKNYTMVLGKKSRLMSGKLNQCMLQAFQGIKETKVFNKENYFIEQYDKSYRLFSRYFSKQGLVGIIPKPIIESVCICGLLAVLSVRISIGGNMESFVPMLSVFAMASFRMLPAFNRITSYMNAIMFNKASVDAVYEDLREVEGLLRHAEKEEADTTVFDLKQGITVNSVTFRYPDSQKPVLLNASLEIPKYSSIALIGQSGAGKTTLADIIMGLLKPESGNIQADGIDIGQHVKAWHRSLGYIPQTIYLIDDTIANNIAYGDENIDEEQLNKAVHDAQLETFIRELPEGLNTVVGEQGVRLSGGQRQRIGIARALYRNPSILVLDEATSALDNETEQAVMESINSLQGKKTMVIIAHRLTTIKNCDRIYEIKDGRAVLRVKEEVLA